MPAGKAAGARCVQLSSDNHCLLFGTAERPAVCIHLQASRDMCGSTSAEALMLLARMEAATRAPEKGSDCR